MRVQFIALPEFCFITCGRRCFFSIDFWGLSGNIQRELHNLQQVCPLSMLPGCGQPSSHKVLQCSLSDLCQLSSKAVLMMLGPLRVVLVVLMKTCG